MDKAVATDQKSLRQSLSEIKKSIWAKIVWRLSELPQMQIQLLKEEPAMWFWGVFIMWIITKIKNRIIAIAIMAILGSIILAVFNFLWCKNLEEWPAFILLLWSEATIPTSIFYSIPDTPVLYVTYESSVNLVTSWQVVSKELWQAIAESDLSKIKELIITSKSMYFNLFDYSSWFYYMNVMFEGRRILINPIIYGKLIRSEIAEAMISLRNVDNLDFDLKSDRALVFSVVEHLVNGIDTLIVLNPGLSKYFSPFNVESFKYTESSWFESYSVFDKKVWSYYIY